MRRFLLLSLGLAACGSSSGGPADAGHPVTAQSYYGLVPGQCFEYSETDGGAPTLGLRVASDAQGLELHLSRHGQDFRVDYLDFDGGLALLTQQDFITGALRSRHYATPLRYAQAPLAVDQLPLESRSAYTDTVDGSGQTGWEVDVLSASPFKGAGGSFPTAFELQFSLTDSQVDGGAPFVTDWRWAVPHTGFVDIYTTNDAQQFVDFSLVDVKDGGSCAAN